MKVDLFYLSMPTNKKYRDKIFTDEHIKNFKYVEGVLFNLPKQYNDDSIIYLYAFTNDRKIADRYENSHDMRIFKRITEKMSKTAFEKFKHEYSQCQIIEYDLSTVSDNLIDELITPKLLCIRNEVFEITDSLKLHVDEELISICSLNYNIFNTNYLKSLDLLFYCTFFNLYNTDKCDEVSYNLSYGITAEGFNTTAMSYGYNLGVIYIKLFGLLLKKDG